MNYDEASDFEINKAVAILLGFTVFDQKLVGESIAHATKTDGFGSSFLDYCNNPSDAWPIIVDNGISLINLKGSTQWFACIDVEFETICMSPDGNDNGVSCFNARLESYCVKPLRAAMICFLKLKESEQ